MAKRGKRICFMAKVPGKKKRKRVCFTASPGGRKRRRSDRATSTSLNGVSPPPRQHDEIARYRCVMQRIVD
mgnify:CR=1 FL=1